MESKDHGTNENKVNSEVKQNIRWDFLPIIEFFFIRSDFQWNFPKYEWNSSTISPQIEGKYYNLFELCKNTSIIVH